MICVFLLLWTIQNAANTLWFVCYVEHATLYDKEGYGVWAGREKGPLQASLICFYQVTCFSVITLMIFKQSLYFWVITKKKSLKHRKSGIKGRVVVSHCKPLVKGIHYQEFIVSIPIPFQIHRFLLHTGSPANSSGSFLPARSEQCQKLWVHHHLLQTAWQHRGHFAWVCVCVWVDV